MCHQRVDVEHVGGLALGDRLGGGPRGVPGRKTRSRVPSSDLRTRSAGVLSDIPSR